MGDCVWLDQRLGAALAFFEKDGFTIAGGFGEGDGLGEVTGDFVRRMGVGGNDEADAGGAREFEKARGRIGGGAGLVPASGIELDDAASRGDDVDDRLVEPIEIAGRDVGEFFHEIRVAEDVENATIGHFRIGFPIVGPDGIDIALCPTAEPFRVVEIPVAEVMDGADEVVPVVAGCEVCDPVFTTSEPVALKAGADGNATGGAAAGAFDPLEIVWKLGNVHAPVVERLRDLRGVVGDAVFSEACGDCGVDIGFRLSFGMAAERCVSVVVGGHLRN